MFLHLSFCSAGEGGGGLLSLHRRSHDRESLPLPLPRDTWETTDTVNIVVSISSIFLPPANKVCKGNVFTRVCLSMGWWCGITACLAGGIPACLAGFQAHIQWGGVEGFGCGGVFRPTPMGGGLVGSGLGGGLQAHTQGEVEGSGQGGPLGPHLGGVSQHADPPPQLTGTAAGGTHPTGMHSCFSSCYFDVKDCVKQKQVLQSVEHVFTLSEIIKSL